MYSEKNYIMWLNSLITIRTDNRSSLIKYFGSCENLWNADRADIAESGLLSKEELELLIRSRYRYDMDKELEKLYHSEANFYIKGEAGYPLPFTMMDDMPLGVYIIGSYPDNAAPFVSIVGSRRVTDYGATVCHSIAKELAEMGMVIVSGMAMGMDAIAHKSCIEGGSKTIAVLGSGADVCYPAANTNLYNEIKYNGCIISEFPLGEKPAAANFPYRNRLIAALGSVTVVVEAAEASGSLITANKALDYGRSVMAVPGNITSKFSVGCNRLISGGCKMYTCVQDILDEMNVRIDKNTLKNLEKDISPLASNEKIVYDCIDYDTITVDELIAKTGMEVRELSAILTLLELKGCIRHLSGQKFVRSL